MAKNRQETSPERRDIQKQGNTGSNPPKTDPSKLVKEIIKKAKN